jgi:hypothetical protein
MKKKHIKKLWHIKNRSIVYNHFSGICQVCNKKINQNEKWDIHHITYDYFGKLYETEALELIKNKIIILICRKCHTEEHTAKDNLNPIHNKYKLENIGKCEYCGRLEHRIYDRKRGMNLEKLTCRNCFLKNKLIDKYGIIQTKLF